MRRPGYEEARKEMIPGIPMLLANEVPWQRYDALMASTHSISNVTASTVK